MPERLPPIDVRAELECFPWVRATWTDDKLIAASPFRYDSHPSFYVYLSDTPTARAGDWGDSGATDPEWQRGGIVKLLAFLRDETTGETLDYLRAKYGAETEFDDEPTLEPPVLSPPEPYRPLDMRLLDAYKFRSPYLGARGISEAVQRLMRVGYDRRRRAVVIPWFNPDGTLGNVKFRRVDEKTFWYVRGGRPIRQMIYGIDVIYRKRLTRAALVEAEIDAMTLMSAGIPAIATGGTGFNAANRDIIARSPLEEVVVIRDNDAAGRKWQRQVIAELGRYVDVRIAVVRACYKDVNESRMENLRAIVEKSRKVKSLRALNLRV